VELRLGLSKEKNAETFGEDCALDKIRPSLPSSDDINLHITVEADIQTEAPQADDPNLLEEEYPCGARVLETKVMLGNPNMDRFDH